MLTRPNRAKAVAGLMTALAMLLAACGEAAPPVTDPAAPIAPPDAPTVTRSLRFPTSDGVELHAYLGGAGDLRPRPLIIEFSPYAPDCCGHWFGSAYNHLQVHVRGTGLSAGQWSAVGPRDQQDIAEFLEWACHQPWSNGHIGLYGFSASAIAIYNSLHLPLACVDAAALMAGTADLYRDLLYPGGILNMAPAAVVDLGVAGPLLQTAPASSSAGRSLTELLLAELGMVRLTAEILSHPVEDDYWQARTHRPGPNRFPVLIDTSFYDPEPRGPFESFKLLRSLGVPVHLRLFGAHDGYPAGTPGPFPEYQRWFDRNLLGIDNGIEREPTVQLLVGEGGFEALRGGDFVRFAGADWPLPGTRWQTLFLGSERGGGARSLNDGQLSPTAATTATVQAYPALISLPTASDPHTTWTLSSAGARSLFDSFPWLNDLRLAEPLALSYTTPAFTQIVDVVGPASLVVSVATATPDADLHAVIADVWPDGSAHAVGVGRLRTAFPGVDAERSVHDGGEIVQPYGDYSRRDPAVPAQVREYQLEFWPIGNRFLAGHRLRLYLVGASGYMLPAPSLNLVSVGGANASRLLLPVLPGSDLCAAMASESTCGAGR